MTQVTVNSSIWMYRRCAAARSLALALTILFLTCIAASWLDSKADICAEQVRAEKERLWVLRNDTLPEEREAVDDLIIDAWVREGELNALAAEYRLYARLLYIGGAATCGAVILVSRRKNKPC